MSEELIRLSDLTMTFEDGETILDVKSYHALGVPVRETANV